MSFPDKLPPINLTNYYNPWIVPGKIRRKQKYHIPDAENMVNKMNKIIERRKA